MTCDRTPWTCLSLKAKSECLLSHDHPWGQCMTFSSVPPHEWLPPPPFVLTSLILHILPSIHTRHLHCMTRYSRIATVLYSVLISAATYELGPLFISVWTVLFIQQIPVEWVRGRERDFWSSLFIRSHVMDVTMCAGSWGNWSKVKATSDFWDTLHLDMMSFAYFWIWCL